MKSSKNKMKTMIQDKLKAIYSGRENRQNNTTIHDLQCPICDDMVWSYVLSGYRENYKRARGVDDIH
jgi:hypothetical protein